MNFCDIKQLIATDGLVVRRFELGQKHTVPVPVGSVTAA